MSEQNLSLSEFNLGYYGPFGLLRCSVRYTRIFSRVTRLIKRVDLYTRLISATGDCLFWVSQFVCTFHALEMDTNILK